MQLVPRTMLLQVDGVGSSSGVFILGATNRPDLLDSALLRPGRLDRLVYVGCPATPAERLLVLQARLRQFTLAPDVDLHAVVAGCSATLTGADYQALATDALMLALRRAVRVHLLPDSEFGEEPGDSCALPHPRYSADSACKGASGGDQEKDVVVQMIDLLEARDSLVPSVSAKEMDKYLQLQLQYEC